MERWLTQRMSSGLGARPGREDGICANVDFPTPRRLITEAVAAASGLEEDAWLPERSVWPLLEVVDESLSELWLQALAAHLGGNPARRFATVRHIADLFDRYALHRPEMVRAWGEGDDAGIPDDAAWQAELFRRLRARIDQPDPAERLRHACARLREEPSLADLPPRLSLFGLTRLPRGYVDVLAALAAGRDVHLFALHPSPALWEKVAAHPKAHPPQGGRDGGAARQPAARLVGPRQPRAAARPRRLRRPPPRHRPDRRLAAAPAPGRRPHRRGAEHRAGRQHPDPLLPRPRPPGRGPQGRDPARARRGPDARAARRDRDVPRHRDVRAADPGHLRHGRRVGAARPPRRPLAAPDQPRARRRRPPARARRRAPHRLPGARPRGPRARPPPLRLRRRRRRPAGGVGARQRHPLGARRRPPRPLPARAHAERHVARRARPPAARRGHDRGRAPAVRARAAARRRRERHDRPRRPLRRADRPPALRGRRAQRGRSRSTSGRRRSGMPPTRSPPPRRATPGSAPSSSGCSTTWWTRPPATPPSWRSRRSAPCSPTASRAARRARTSAPAT